MLQILNSAPFVPFTAVSVFIFGMLTGSFVNVCIYRIPLEKSIIFPPSSCTECDHRIKWYENIPVLSWLFLKGKCSGCKKKISMIYPFIEMTNGFLYLVAFFRFGISSDLFFVFYFISAMVVTAVIDFKTQYVYSKVVLPVAFLGVLRAFISPSITALSSIAGMVAGAGLLLLAIAIFYAVTRKIGMGLGDVYILGAIGAFTGIGVIPFVLFAASFGGIVFFIIAKLVFKKRRLAKNITQEDINSDNEKDLDNAIYFGPFLAAAGVLTLLTPTYLLDTVFYFRLF